MSVSTANFQIVTNNPQARDAYPDVIAFCEGGVYDVFVAVRDLVHGGCRLISHPLAGSVKPNETPYKSVVVSLGGNGTLDFFSLRLIEGAFEVLKKLTPRHINYTERMLDDYQVIDLDLLHSAIQSLPAEYHF